MRLVLLADLHFGREDPSLLPHLLAAISASDPDLVLIAGDFVQRARSSHFRRAHDFLARLSAPWVGVPGNHDLPLFNLPERLLLPLRSYRQWITEETQPTLQNERISLVGVDTTDRWAHQRGRIDDRQIERVSREIRHSGDRLPVILVHHPFHQGPDIEKKLMRGAGAALQTWSECGPHVILSGHLHSFKVEPFVTRKGNRQTLQVHCGSSASTRHRGNPNDIAILDISPPRIRISRLVYDGDGGFEDRSVHRYRAGPDGWTPDEDRETAEEPGSPVDESRRTGNVRSS